MHRHWRTTAAALPDSVAFTGMGEALANPHLFPALRLLTSPGYAGLSLRRITVSTVGFAPNLARLTREHPQVTLTLSVHSAFAGQRATLIPSRSELFHVSVIGYNFSVPACVTAPRRRKESVIG